MQRTCHPSNLAHYSVAQYRAIACLTHVDFESALLCNLPGSASVDSDWKTSQSAPNASLDGVPDNNVNASSQHEIFERIKPPEERIKW